MALEFWDVISQSKGEVAKLGPILEGLSDEEVTEFGKTFYENLIKLNRWSIWGAGYVMAGGMGDDAFHYFRSWIIGKGKEAFETALANPDELGQFASEGDDFENELLEYVAIDVLEGRGLGDPRELVDGFADDDPEGEAWDEDTIDALYPKLAARFG